MKLMKFGLVGLSTLFVLASCEGGAGGSVEVAPEGDIVRAPGPEGRIYYSMTSERGVEYFERACVDGVTPQELGFYQPSDAPANLDFWHSPYELISYLENGPQGCTMIFGTMDDVARARVIAARDLSAEMVQVLDRSLSPSDNLHFIQISVPR